MNAQHEALFLLEEGLPEHAWLFFGFSLASVKNHQAALKKRYTCMASDLTPAEFADVMQGKKHGWAKRRGCARSTTPCSLSIQQGPFKPIEHFALFPIHFHVYPTVDFIPGFPHWQQQVPGHLRLELAQTWNQMPCSLLALVPCLLRPTR